MPDKRKQAMGIARKPLWLLPAVLGLTAIAYLPVLKNGFVNWDDIVYILNNHLITEFSAENFYSIFSSFFMGNYHPVTILSLSIDYQLFGYNPTGYHLVSLLIHLLNTYLVYIFAKKILKNHIPSVIVALLFGIHPMHVESVAWASERKDLLYTCFYLLAIIRYLKYLTQKNAINYISLLLMFLLSLLSKAQAVTLPLVLLLVDFLLMGRVRLNELYPKLPLFALSLLFGVIAVFAQAENNDVNPFNIPITQNFIYALYGFALYMVKFLFPVNLTSFYDHPFTMNDSIPYYIYISLVAFVIFMFSAWYFKTRNRMITFGLLFFLVTILPVLQFLPVGKAIIAERYTYIPYIGLSLVAIESLALLLEKLRGHLRMATLVICSLLVIFFLAQTWNRTKVWKNGLTLWTDVLEKNPKSVNAFMNRAFLFTLDKRYDLAVEECNRCLLVDSTNALIYKNRAIAYSRMGKFNEAVSDYSRAIQFSQDDYELYLFRGILYTDKLGQHQMAIRDFRQYLRFDPDSEKANYNLFVAFYNLNQFDSAKHYCTRVLEINPSNSTVVDYIPLLDSLTHER